MKFRNFYNKIRCIFYKKILSTCIKLKIESKLTYPILFLGKGNIHIKKSHLGVYPSPFFFNTVGYLEARNSSASILIKNNTIINNNFVVIADQTSVTIGENCLIGPNVFITDSDFHGLKVKDRVNGNYQCLPTVIEDNVFIGENVRILKGVTIGEGSVIGCGSVVSKNVPPNSIYAGNPGKFIKFIDNT
jgi:maltose O-acetyltransferase